MSKNVFLLPGEAHYAKNRHYFTSGSCVALVLHDPVRKWGGMNHICCQPRNGNSGLSGKYSDKAIPNLIRVATMSAHSSVV